jgi:hypothetical protein
VVKHTHTGQAHKVATYVAHTQQQVIIQEQQKRVKSAKSVYALPKQIATEKE